MCQLAEERVRGLDFTLPAASGEIKNSREYNGYCKTPEKHVRMLLESLGICYAESSFLDIGCGKGAVLRVAAGMPFCRVAGIELDRELVGIAQRNMKRLGLENVECIQGNAASFDRYGEFNVFFLFNPFSAAVLAQVTGKILQTLEDSPREITIIYHHPLHSSLLDVPGLHRTGVFYDRLKQYETYVYSNRAQGSIQ